MNDINLDLYKHFYMVAKYKSMTKAANELMISQPAISKSIKSLESQIGTILFNRSNKALELTSEGKMLYSRIKPALELISSAEDELKEYETLNEGEINIGISSVLTKCLLLDTLKSFKLKYPNIKISIKNGLTKDLISNLNDGQLDFVIYNESPIKETNIDNTLLTTMDYVFCYNEIFYKNIKDIEDLKKNPLILQEKKSNTRRFLDEYTKNELNADMEVLSQDLICSLVESGLGIGFVFEELLDNNYKELKTLKLKEIPSANIHLAKNKNLKSSFASRTFIKELKKNI